MGHYLSEMVGLPFDFKIEVKLTEDEFKLAIKELRKEGPVLSSSIRVTYESITMDSSRKWFEIHYRRVEKKHSMDGGMFQSFKRSFFSEKRLKQLDSLLEKRREEILKTH